jgi:NADH:ubiquinone oxidoreductase subunit F (NADH-binding)/(2Fe-2S) ferredoxin
MSVKQRYQSLVDAAWERAREEKQEQGIRIHVGSATCENAAGATKVEQVIRKLIEESSRRDIFIKRRGCTGRCSQEPIVTVEYPGTLPIHYHNVTPQLCKEIVTSHVLSGIPVSSAIVDIDGKPVQTHQLVFCEGGRCSNIFSKEIRKRFNQSITYHAVPSGNIGIVCSKCFGLCSQSDSGNVSYVMVRPGNTVYRITKPDDVDEIVERHIIRKEIVTPLLAKGTSVDRKFFELYGDVVYFRNQSRVALRNCGVVDPESIDDYLLHNGFHALSTVLDKNEQIWPIDEMERAHLRGRGGAGYPTAKKWRDVAQSSESVKYIICNADEGDPGAFMDRDMLESDPLSVIEGMLIAAYSIGASQGFFYIRSEYPLAISRVENALSLCRVKGLLGKGILESNFTCEIEVREGAGAFVCGEETALIASIEGKRGWPRIRPPYPSKSGLWGSPTVINNVETLANVPVIIEYGSEWFASMGSSKSGGTKVFALSGRVVNTGLVEVPMGTMLKEIVYTIGGGVPDNKKLKAVQTGGPAGGCIPLDLLDTVVDYDTLSAIGSIMGSGGMIVMDETKCMVDTARFFMAFSQDESCGECTPCREGTKRLLEILDRIIAGKGVLEDLGKLERLCILLQKASLCGLGRAAPNPVLSTLRYFRNEYEMHVKDKFCPAGQCSF